MRIGLFFGSFNPIHTGHTTIAAKMLEQADLDRVWFVVSPLSPFKNDESLASGSDRLAMVKKATVQNSKFEVSDVEFGMPRPSYTIDTLLALSENYPEHEFVVIIGEDNLLHFQQWKQAEEILIKFNLLVYPRPGGSPPEWRENQYVTFIEAPIMDISATQIREKLKSDHSVEYDLDRNVLHYIKDKNLYS